MLMNLGLKRITKVFFERAINGSFACPILFPLNKICLMKNVFVLRRLITLVKRI